MDFAFEHVFSCEIEPFKQAYIERNFSPPILFRDVCELGDGYAHTAYGALEPVPGDVDLLVLAPLGPVVDPRLHRPAWSHAAASFAW